MNGLMIVGTDTGVGKTMLCELILVDALERGKQIGIYKPVCTGSETEDSGNSVWNDIERLYAASGGVFDRELICPQRFHAPLAPPVAAGLEGKRVDADQLNDGLRAWSSHVDTLLIEGVGGLLCPVTDDITVADLAAKWRVPIIVVAANRLGTINHTLLTLELADRRGLNVAGWIMNQAETDEQRLLTSNVAEIRRRTSARFLGEIAFAGSRRLQSEKLSTRILVGHGVESLEGLPALARPVKDTRSA